ncbi:hypothetical protein BDZ89DRAFT_1057855 [Hymenopellis radicata]|nr:hypothetical protein BDZ89DRAFT_1057855 [Hymenopellis radicata]
MICSQCGHASPEQLEILPKTTLTRIKELLASNVAPHGTENTQLSELMSRTQSYATTLDMHIADLRASLEDMLAQKVQIEQRLLEVKTILHPIRSFPPEILAEIFDDVVSAAADAPLDSVRHGNFVDSLYMNAPHWVISHVSSHWRRAALTTPRIWRFVHLSFDRHPKNLSTPIFLNRFLSRSGNHTLDVLAHGTSDHPALTVLLLSSTRWRTAAVSFEYQVYRSWNAAQLIFSALTRLHFHVQLPDIVLARQVLRSLARRDIIIITCPQLRSFSSDTPGAFVLLFNLHAEAPIEIFEQTGCLDVDLFQHGISFVAPAIIIAKPSLISARFHLTRPVPPQLYSGRYKPVRDDYPNIRVLKLSGTQIGQTDFFSRFTFPHLQELSFDDVVAGCEDDEILFFPSPMIHPTGQDLKKLQVSLQNATDTDNLIAFLRTTPKLCHLELTLRTRFDISFTMKSILMDEQDLIPALTRLIIVAKEGADIAQDFVDSVKHRRSGEDKMARLDEVVVDYVVSIDEHVEAAFNALLSDGLTGTLKVH